VLTIGSVHLDTIALSQAETATDDVTQIGNITHSVGGSAYNVAANLATDHGRQRAVRDVAIYSILPQHSVLTEIIKYKIDAAGVSSRFIRLFREFNDRHVRGGGYVGVLDDQRLIRQAVVDAAMHDANIFQNRDEGEFLMSAMAWGDALVVDADLAVSIVNRVAEHASDHGKQFFVSVGSPSAGRRGWIHSHDENVATCLSGRLGVLSSILEQLEHDAAEIAAFRAFVEKGAAATAFDVNGICARLKTRHLVSCQVRESQGIALLAAGDPPYSCFLPIPKEVQVRLRHGKAAGVMDGALAGFVEAFARASRRDKEAGGAVVSEKSRRLFGGTILDFVEHVSQSEGATPGSVISFEEQAREQSRWAKLWRLTKIAVDVLPVFRYLVSIAALIVALWLVETSIDVLGWLGYHVELPDKAWVRMLLRR
jgi:sugar/nucleoside kinase (ribokinase family)